MPPSSLERFHYLLKGLNCVFGAEYKEEERTGKGLCETCNTYPNVIQNTAEIDLQ